MPRCLHRPAGRDYHTGSVVRYRGTTDDGHSAGADTVTISWIRLKRYPPHGLDSGCTFLPDPPLLPSTPRLLNRTRLRTPLRLPPTCQCLPAYRAHTCPPTWVAVHPLLPPCPHPPGRPCPPRVSTTATTPARRPTFAAGVYHPTPTRPSRPAPLHLLFLCVPSHLPQHYTPTPPLFPLPTHMDTTNTHTLQLPTAPPCPGAPGRWDVCLLGRVPHCPSPAHGSCYSSAAGLHPLFPHLPTQFGTRSRCRFTTGGFLPPLHPGFLPHRPHRAGMGGMQNHPAS